MGGFFGFFDYSKPGPGIPKDLPPKSKFIVFFEVLGRKFWKLCYLNLLYFITSLPILFIIYLIFGSFILPYIQDTISAQKYIENAKNIESMLFMFLNIFVIGGFMAFGIGPTTAGYTYILRNFAREEHAWVTSDFFENIKKNIKESIITLVVDFIILFTFYVNIRFYSAMEKQYPTLYLVKYFIFVAFAIYLMMHIFIYPMMVTYNLKVRHIYKNAFIFTILKLPHTIGILLIILAVLLIPAVIFLTTGFILAMFLYFVLWVSIIGLIQNFFTNYVFNEYLNPNRNNEQLGNNVLNDIKDNDKISE